MEEHFEDPTKKGFSDLITLATKYKQENPTNPSDCVEIDPGKEDALLISKEEQESNYRALLLERRSNLSSLMNLLNNRHKNISAIFKSRIDWKKFTATNNLDKQFRQNRKAGYIQNQMFLNKVTDRVHNLTKQLQK